MFNKWNLDYFKKAGSLEDWLQLSGPTAFPRSSLGVETTCVAPVGNSGLMTPGSLMTQGALLGQPCSLASQFSLGSDSAGWGWGGVVCMLLGGQIRRLGVGGEATWSEASGFALGCCVLLVDCWPLFGVPASGREGGCCCLHRHIWTCLTQAMCLNACTHKRGKFSLTELNQNFSIRKTEIKSQICLS